MSERVLDLAVLQEHFEARRRLRRLEIPERFGPPLAGCVVYYYDMVTLEERQAVMRHAKLQADGAVVIDEQSVAEGLTVRLRDADGKRVLFDHGKSNLMTHASADFLRWIWVEIGGVGTDTTVEEGVEAAGKG